MNLMKMDQKDSDKIKRSNSNIIQLTFNEKKFFDTIIQVYKTEKKIEDTTPRIVGEWVRDKILGRNSNERDIAIDGERRDIIWIYIYIYYFSSLVRINKKK